MDGLLHGKPYEQMNDLGGPPLFLETPTYTSEILRVRNTQFWEAKKTLQNHA